MSDEKTTDTPPLDPERLDLRSHDIPDEKRKELLRLFPEVRTEGGKLDFDRLKLALGESVDVGRERYALTWPGKADCFKAIQTPSMGTLRPCPEESVNFDTTENLIIEGDNLEVLKLLQKSYLGKVKMIYIDPPYNTGNDFIYPDNYAESLQTYLEYTGQVDSQGKKFSTNTEAEGRFHSKWLSMMYPRLYLARNLLSDAGLLFISISDVELANLRALCNEVFGEENHIGTFVWSNEGNIDNQSRIKVNHEYVIAYARSEDRIGAPPVIDPNIPRNSKLFLPDIENTIVKNGPANPVSAILVPAKFPAECDDGSVVPDPTSWPRWDKALRVAGGKLEEQATASSGWSSRDLLEAFIKNGFQPVVDTKGQSTTFFISSTAAIMSRKKRLESQSHVLTILRGMGTVQSASAKLAELGITFSYPKPTDLLEYLIRVGSAPGDIILDFFAGSGTVGEAVVHLNEKDDGRRFILVQLPEPIGGEGTGTVAGVTIERVRRVARKLGDNKKRQPLLPDGSDRDRGFRVFKLGESNFRPWTADVVPDAAALSEQLRLHVEHVRADRTSQDILYEILLKSGFPLTTSVETLAIEGKTVSSVAGGTLLVCLEPELTLELIRALADRQPERVVCLDAGFAGKDQLKANAVQIFRSKGVTSFKTV